IVQKTVLISIEAINRHTVATGLHRTASTALPDIYMDAIDKLTIHAIMRQDVQPSTIRVQFKDTRTLCAGKMNGLHGNNLQNFVKVERRGDDRRDPVNG